MGAWGMIKTGANVFWLTMRRTQIVRRIGLLPDRSQITSASYAGTGRKMSRLKEKDDEAPEKPAKPLPLLQLAVIPI